jgi:hypothetical protein
VRGVRRNENILGTNVFSCESYSPKSKLDPLIMVGRLKSSERRLHAQQAKEFLISQVVEEAQKENVPLSEVERKMLFFTETQETLPDMLDVNEQFEREYDGSTYEKKIATLLYNAFEHSRRETPEGERRWKQAITDLRNEDHYLLVMVDQSLQLANNSWTDIAIGVGIGLLIVTVTVAWVFLDLNRFVPRWAFGWMSDDPHTAKLQIYLLILGLIALWFVIKLAKLGLLGGMVKDALDGILSTISFGRLGKRPRG